MEDAKIVLLYNERNESAIVETERKYGKLLYSIAVNILKNHEDSEETVNDTYEKAWSHIPPDKPNILAAYLGRITRNLSINLFHKSRASKRYSGGDVLLSELEDCLPAELNVEGQVELSQLTDVINGWLGSISKEDRVLFVRRYWHCISVEDLAKESGTEANKLASKLFRLRQKLKAELEKAEIYV